MMRCGPVDTAALGTPKKVFLGQEDVFRDRFFDGRFRTWLQATITNQATPEEIVAPSQLKCADDLTQLFAEIIAFYKKKLLWLPKTQSAVTRENNSVFLARRMDQPGA
jgi:hypothetical protein